jgi:hypothetical protein
MFEHFFDANSPFAGLVNCHWPMPLYGLAAIGPFREKELLLWKVHVLSWFWPDIRRVFGQIYAVFLAEIYALRVFLENTAYNTGRIFLVIYAVSLCRRALLWLGLANGSPGCWISVSARRGLEWCIGPSWSRWSVAFGALSHNYVRWGRVRCTRVMGVYSAACPQRRASM